MAKPLPLSTEKIAVEIRVKNVIIIGAVSFIRTSIQWPCYNAFQLYDGAIFGWE
jgi:hypothetical protein